MRRGVAIGKLCKYCGDRMYELSTTGWFGGIWKKTDPGRVCPTCDKLGPPADPVPAEVVDRGE